MNILAIDPGERAGVAQFTDGELEYRFVCDGAKVIGRGNDYDAESAIEDASYSACCVVCESVQNVVGRTSHKAMATKYWRQHLWRALAELYGLQWIEVHPATWQAHFGLIHRRKRGRFEGMTAKEKNKSKSAEYKENKEAIRKLASEKIGRPVEQDEADAILIGLWAVETKPWENTK